MPCTAAALRALGCAAAVVAAAVAAGADPAAPRPNVLLIVVDDLGWTNVGWHSPNDPQVKTPALNQLVAEGLELDRMYAYK